MVGVIDFRWAGAVGPAQSPTFGDDRVQFAAACHAVIGAAREVQLVGVGTSAVCPVS
jgi:hypothetical protein